MARRARANRIWYLLLVPPAVAPLLTPLYNRIEPTVWGLPFFYWYQLMCAVLAMVLITVVHMATRERRHEWQ
ncbi:hypothetical protein Ais01nite_59720 [Asanoa ishikariensis]|uniref:Uncharacterized protein n=1 Tax=Asanoa ishikariensis TaxID=137265 RepID=A0A1H3PBR6_9ACTN|nr:DUF3311 domain-containing protein [Asanoa ishikariensis]GIF67937.1 hypothetical protein Ais01nite_59720 [Asanoa ishikariensis]SDY98527.1 Protein of unknown function [Asanoa ishikariensis]